MTSFNNPQKGSYINSSDFTKMKNAIKALTQKTMDFNLSSSNLDAIDTNRGSLIYAKDMNTMMRIISDMGKYCVCKNKEACNCKEACNSNCSCRGHCTCNSYDPCSCVSYTPPPPCSCQSHSSPPPCSCKSHSGCGCQSYSSRKRVIAFGQTGWNRLSGAKYYDINNISSKLPSGARNIIIESSMVMYNIFYSMDKNAPVPTDTYVNSIANESNGTMSCFGVRQVYFEINGLYYNLVKDPPKKYGLFKSDWSIKVLTRGQRVYDYVNQTYVTYDGVPCRQCEKLPYSLQNVSFPYFSKFSCKIDAVPFCTVLLIPPSFPIKKYFKNDSQYVYNNVQIIMVLTYE